MSDKIAKFLRKLTPKQREVLEELMERLVEGDFAGMDIKKMVGETDLYRLRKGSVRVVGTGEKSFVWV